MFNIVRKKYLEKIEKESDQYFKLLNKVTLFEGVAWTAGFKAGVEADDTAEVEEELHDEMMGRWKSLVVTVVPSGSLYELSRGFITD